MQKGEGEAPSLPSHLLVCVLKLPSNHPFYRILILHTTSTPPLAFLCSHTCDAHPLLPLQKQKRSHSSAISCRAHPSLEPDWRRSLRLRSYLTCIILIGANGRKDGFFATANAATRAGRRTTDDWTHALGGQDAQRANPDCTELERESLCLLSPRSSHPSTLSAAATTVAPEVVAQALAELRRPLATPPGSQVVEAAWRSAAFLWLSQPCWPSSSL